MAWLCTPCIWTSRDLFWISIGGARRTRPRYLPRRQVLNRRRHPRQSIDEKFPTCVARSEEHTSELQSRLHLVCRLLLEKKKKTIIMLQTVHQRDRSSPALSTN